jgi:hypothetical protein
MRCSKCSTKGAEVVAIALPCPRGRGVRYLSVPYAHARGGRTAKASK